MSVAPVAPLLKLLATAAPVPAGATLPEYWQGTVEIREASTSSLHDAVAGGFRADRLGFAFAAGYNAALAMMFGLGARVMGSFCVTESTGARPRDIRTRLTRQGDAWKLSGEKAFVSGAPTSTVLFVVASTGDGADGRPALKIARVLAGQQGVKQRPLDELPFVPEVPHATVTFDEVRVAGSDLAEGDGYDRYVRPFRSVEDLHVNAALLGYLCSVARRFDWPRTALESLLSLVVTNCALEQMAHDAPEAQIALAGFLAQVRGFVESCAPHFEKVAPEERARWERDRPLMLVAERVRAQRLERAWERIRA